MFKSEEDNIWALSKISLWGKRLWTEAYAKLIGEDLFIEILLRKDYRRQVELNQAWLDSLYNLSVIICILFVNVAVQFLFVLLMW